MNQKLFLIIIAIFLIGNFHVVTDWCDDLPENTSLAFDIQVDDNGHNEENDLCGHCGHLGLNVLQITPHEIDVIVLNTKSNPIHQKTAFISNYISPPTPPPLYLS